MSDQLKPSVLVVDDELQIRELAGEVLSEQGYRVELYNDGIQALAAIKTNPSACSLVVTDMAMPGMSGAEVARHAKNSPDLTDHQN